MSFMGFRKYLTKMGIVPAAFDEAYERMRSIAYHLVASVSQKILRKQYTFEVRSIGYSCLGWTSCWTNN